MQTVTVSQLVSRVNRFLQEKVNLSRVLISGELSNVKNVNGHYYFDLKDDNGQISCTMWRSRTGSLLFRPEDGMQVLVSGSLNVYEKRGSLQLAVQSMEQDGYGLLAARLEELKRKLDAQGLFAPAHKKPRPETIEKIALVTGAGTAALQDILKTIRSRWPMLSVTLYPALVQGENAPAQIVEQLRRADEGGYDAVLLCRGGGSFEDLFCFNDEQIVRTLYDMKTYTVTGIGHEIDTTLADLAADHRAVTPTAAAQWVTPDQKEVMARILHERALMERNMQMLFERSASSFVALSRNPWLQDPMSWLESRMQKLAGLQASLKAEILQQSAGWNSRLQQSQTRLNTGIRQTMEYDRSRWLQLERRLLSSSPNNRLLLEAQKQQMLDQSLISSIRRVYEKTAAALDQRTSLLNAVGPENVLARGYAMVYAGGRPVACAKELQTGEHVQLVMKDAIAGVLVEDVKERAPSSPL